MKKNIYIRNATAREREKPHSNIVNLVENESEENESAQRRASDDETNDYIGYVYRRRLIILTVVTCMYVNCKLREYM